MTQNLPPKFFKPIPVAARSKALLCYRLLPRIVCSNPAGGTDVTCDCCVMSSRGLWVGLIRPEESHAERCD